MIWINLLRFRASVRTRSGADALGDGYPGGTDPIGVLTGVPAARGSGSFLTRRWRKADSNSRSRSCESVCRVLQKGDAGPIGWVARHQTVGLARCLDYQR